MMDNKTIQSQRNGRLYHLRMLIVHCIFIVLTYTCGICQSEPVSFTSWRTVNFDLPDNTQGPGNWVVSNDDTLAVQVNNSEPSFFLNNIISDQYTMEGTISINITNDDDFVGLVFGYQDSSHFYLLDWKQFEQVTTSGGTAEEGFVIRKISAPSFSDLTTEDFWSTEGTQSTIILATSTGEDKGWEEFVQYSYHLDFESERFNIRICDNESELLNMMVYDSEYSSGEFGFYTLSQHMVEYTAIIPAEISANRIDLSTWTQCQIDLAGPLEPGNYCFNEDNTITTQTINCDPTFLLNNINSSSFSYSGTIKVITEVDNDHIGFVYCYQNPSHYYIFDWKQLNQTTEHGESLEGFSVKKIDAPLDTVLSIPDFWESSGTEYSEVLVSDFDPDKGWSDFSLYTFDFNYSHGETSIDIYENGRNLWNTVFIDSTYLFGQFGFYCSSQQMVEFSVFDIENISITNTAPLQLPHPSKVLRTTYDLFYSAQDIFNISIQISDDEGITWNVPAVNIWGDIGPNISPGTGKTIYWNAGLDYPNQFNDNMRIKIIADDGQ